MAAIRDQFLSSRKEQRNHLLKLCSAASWYDGLPSLLAAPILGAALIWPIAYLGELKKRQGYGWAKVIWEGVQNPSHREPILLGFAVMLVFVLLSIRLYGMSRKKLNIVLGEMKKTVHPAEATAFFCFEAADALRSYASSKMPSDFGLGGDMDYIQRQEIWHLRGKATYGVCWNTWNTHAFFVVAKTAEEVHAELERYGWIKALGENAGNVVAAFLDLSRFMATSKRGGFLSGNLKDAANFLDQLGELFVLGIQNSWNQFLARLQHLQKRCQFHSITEQKPLGVIRLADEFISDRSNHIKFLFSWLLYVIICAALVCIGLGPGAELASRLAREVDLRDDLVFWQTVIIATLGICLPAFSPIFRKVIHRKSI